jgi:hypothetical protein
LQTDPSAVIRSPFAGWVWVAESVHIRLQIFVSARLAACNLL